MSLSPVFSRPPATGCAASPTGALPVVLASEAVVLLPDSALWWPAGRTLFIADLHLGKAATFRARGLPVPGGTTQENLHRLSRLVAAHGAERLVILGDFLHAAESQTPGVLAALRAWRALHATLEIVLVRGNHDSHAGDLPASLGIAIVNEPHLLGPFACCHHPQRHPTHTVLAGHVHPALQLRGPGRDALRLPCFSVEPGLVVLPAFGEFTGTFALQPVAGRALYAVGGGRVWAVPAASPVAG
ncbi:ligase-associated DNA damage response endonuclease PdeM [Xylophilus sp. Leaf220]|uniref:ligase-associated DNA damage response endonuclease PdeM n=1 Tax=Xylophilus sp. Leaf220 TaxID=1735686 RepID=UPI0009EC967B|nr:ligase-associated DNA damage response endonuclease PdeM [Xylophilus sp. Leaf220]